MKPRNYQGTRDWLAEDVHLRQRVINTLIGVFQQFGFEPLETPVIELKETLLDKYGEEGDRLMYTFLKGGDSLGLRYDMTVPLARVVAQHQANLVMPYRRYAIGPVFRADTPQKGRFRQFTQCDFDIVGIASPLADAEVVALNYFALTRLGFRNFTVQVCDRKLLDGMARTIGATDQDQALAILRAWDKIKKASREQIAQELKEAGMNDELIASFNRITDGLIEARESADPLGSVEKLFLDSERVAEDTKTLRSLVAYVERFGVPDTSYSINPLLARGLTYYTGPIFETVVEEAQVGSITGGGRFDNLIETLGGPSLPATGSSFGLERLTAVMETLGISKPVRTKTQAYVAVFNPKDPKSVAKAIGLTAKLRERFNVELYEGTQPIGKQLQIADRRGIPVAVFAGDEELARGTTVVKDLSAPMTEKDKSTNQKEVLEKDLLRAVGTLLDRD